MLVGTLRSWKAEHGYGIVAVKFGEYYFLHVGNIKEVPDGVVEPQVGATVEFETVPALKGGKYPQAINARINPTTGGAR
jgi:cold shock CspA family protein